MLDPVFSAYFVAIGAVAWMAYTDLKRNKVDERRISFMQGVTIYAWIVSPAYFMVLPVFILSGLFAFVVFKGAALGDKLNLLWMLPFIYLFDGLIGIAQFFAVTILALGVFYYIEKKTQPMQKKIPFLACLLIGLIFSRLWV